MTTRTSDQRVPRLVHTAEAIIESTSARFGRMTAEQLNWRPGADRWSIAQCYDHLVTANAAYFPTFEAIARGETVRTVWRHVPWYPALWGRIVLRAFGPDSTRRLNAPRVFRPSRSSIDPSIIDRFVDQQRQLIGYMEATASLNLERIVISSPVTRLIAYSVLDTYRMLIAHERRHIRQATRVSEMVSFPTSKD